MHVCMCVCAVCVFTDCVSVGHSISQNPVTVMYKLSVMHFSRINADP